MNFKEYWESRPSIEYEEMVEAKAAFDFQQKRIDELEQELSVCVEIIEESGVDYDEVMQAYTAK